MLSTVYPQIIDQTTTSHYSTRPRRSSRPNCTRAQPTSAHAALRPRRLRGYRGWPAPRRGPHSWCGTASTAVRFRPVAGLAESCASGLQQAAVGEGVGAFVAGVSGVALDPEPLDLMSFDRGLQSLPQIGVLDRLLGGGHPAGAFPVG